MTAHISRSYNTTPRLIEALPVKSNTCTLWHYIDTNRKRETAGTTTTTMFIRGPTPTKYCML